MRLNRCCLIYLFLSLLLVAKSDAQAPSQDSAAPVPTFKATARTVIVDVVVTADHEQPVAGLGRDDFEVTEEGRPQTISYFEEHRGSQTEKEKAAATQPLPPNVFTNVPRVTPTDSVNVLLMDALNTQLEDQSNVHKQMVSYLKELPPDTRMAIFLMSVRLRLIQGFTTDPGVLKTAIARAAAGPQFSPVLRTSTDKDLDAKQVSQLMEIQASLSAPSTVLQATIDAIKEFQQEQADFALQSRIHQTLEAFQQIARYLAGIPGRKNLIWVSGSFPVTLSDGTQPFQEEVAKTSEMLAAAQVAIYPVGAAGLAGDPIIDSSPAALPTVTTTKTAIQEQQANLLAGATARNANMGVMDQLASATGGKAIYNTNGLKEAVARVVTLGSRYYTIAYTPAETRLDGSFRGIKVRVKGGHYTLAYRRGYFEDTVKSRQAADSRPVSDPLRPLMDRGMPAFTEVLYQMHVRPASEQPAADVKRAGDNAKLTGPTTRYGVDFLIRTDGLKLDETGDGVRHGSVEVALVAYDHDGHGLNWMTRTLELGLKPATYATAQERGIPVHLEIDAPAGEVYLRSGLYDLSSNKAGTLEIPLSEVTMAAK